MDPTKPEEQIEPSPIPPDASDTPLARWDKVKADPAWSDPTSQGSLNTDQRVSFLDAELERRVVDAQALPKEDYKLAMGILDEWYKGERYSLESSRQRHDALWLKGNPSAFDQMRAVGTRLKAGAIQSKGAVETAGAIATEGMFKGMKAMGVEPSTGMELAAQQFEEEARRDTVEIPEQLLQAMDPRVRDRTSTAGKVFDATVQSLPTLAATFLVAKGANLATNGSRLATVAPFLFGAALEAGPTYHNALAELTSQGMPLDQAESLAVRAWAEHGTISGALEAITPVLFLQHLDKASGGQLKKTLARKLAGTALELTKETVSEGVTEALQEAWGQNVARRYFLDPKLSDQEREQMLTQWKIEREIAGEAGSISALFLGGVLAAVGAKGHVPIVKDPKTGQLRAKLDTLQEIENRIDLANIAKSGPAPTESFITEDPRYQAAGTDLEAATAAQVIAYEKEFSGRPGFEVAFQIHKGERTLQQEVEEKALTPEEAFAVITNSSALPDKSITPQDVRVFGRNTGEFVGKVYKASIDIYAGATPQDVAEEVSEAWFKAGLHSGTIDIEGYKALKKRWEEKTGERHQDDTPRGLTEWFSDRSVEFATMRARRGESLTEVGKNLGAWLESFGQKPEASTAGNMASAMTRFRTFVAQSIRGARNLLRVASGNPDAKFLSDFEAATGMSAAHVTDQATANAAIPEPLPASRKTRRQQQSLNDLATPKPTPAAPAPANGKQPVPRPYVPPAEITDQAVLEETVRELTQVQRKQVAELVAMSDANRRTFLQTNQVSDKVIAALDLMSPEDSFYSEELLRRARKADLEEFRRHQKTQVYDLDEGIRLIGGLQTPTKATDAGDPLASEFSRVQKESGRKIIGRFKNRGLPYDQAVNALKELGFDFQTPNDLVQALESHDRGSKVYSRSTESADELMYSTGTTARVGNEVDTLRATFAVRSKQATVEEYLDALASNNTARLSDRARKRLQDLRSRLESTVALDKATRESLKSDVKTLEQIVSEMPKEIRGRLGGFSTLMGMAKPSTRGRYLLDRMQRAIDLTEDHSQATHLANIETLFESARTTIAGTERMDAAGNRLKAAGEGNRKETGKMTPETQRLVNLAERVSALNPEQADTRSTELEGIMNQFDPLSDEFHAAHEEWDMIQTFGALEERTADELAIAERYLTAMIKSGRTMRNLLSDQRKDFVKSAKDDIKRSVGVLRPSRNTVSRSKVRHDDLGRRIDTWATEKLDVSQLLERLFPGSRFARDLAGRLRQAKYSSAKALRAHRKAFETAAGKCLGLSDKVKIQNVLVDWQTPAEKTGVRYFKFPLRTKEISLADARALFEGKPPSQPFDLNERKAASKAWEEHVAEGERLKIAAFDKAKAKRLATDISFSKPVSLTTSDPASVGMRKLVTKIPTEFSEKTFSMMADMQDTWVGSVGWQKDAQGRPTLYQKGDGVFALFVTSKAGEAVKGQFFRVKLTQDANAQPEMTPEIRGWKNRKKVKIRFRPEETEEQMLSRFEAMNDWLLLRQPQYAEQASEMGFPPGASAQLERFLGPQAIALALHMQGVLDNQWHKINPVYERTNGVTMARNENYWPGNFQTAGNMENPVDPFGPDHHVSAMKDGFTKRRVVHAAEPKRVSALHVFFGQVAATEHYTAFAETARDMRAVFQDPEIAKAIQSAHGPKRFSQLSNWSKLIEGGGSVAAELHLMDYEVISGMMRNLAVASLAWRATTTLVQTSNAFATMAEISQPNWWAAAGRLARNPGRMGQVISEMWKSEGIQRRIEEGFSPEMMLLMAPGRPKKASNWRKIGELGLEIINRSDAGSLSLSLAVAWEHHYNAALTSLKAEGAQRANDAGITGAADRAKFTADFVKANLGRARTSANQLTEETLSRVEQPTHFLDKSLAENAKNPAMKAGLLMFISDPRRKMSNLYMAAARLAMTKDPKMRAPLGRLVMLYFLLMPAWEASMRGLAKLIFQNKDASEAFNGKNYLEEILTGPTSGISIFGPIYEMAIRKAMGSRTYSRNPMIDTIAGLWEVAGDGKKLVKAFQDHDPAEAINSLGKAINRIGAAANGSLGSIGNIICNAGGIAGNVADLLQPEDEKPAPMSRRQAALTRDLEAMKRKIDKEKEPAKAKEKLPPMNALDKSLEKFTVDKGRRATAATKILSDPQLSMDEKRALVGRWKKQKLLSDEVIKQLKTEHLLDVSGADNTPALVPSVVQDLDRLAEPRKAEDKAKADAKKAQAKTEAPKTVDPIQEALSRLEVKNGERAAGIARVLESYRDDPAKAHDKVEAWRKAKLISRTVAGQLLETHGIDVDSY